MKKHFLSKKMMLLLALAVILLLGSAVGSTRAALTYYSDNYVVGINTSKLEISILENGDEKEGLLKDMLSEGEAVVLGKDYEEVINVKNTGSIDSYVRIILTKSWVDENGVKDTTLSPELIHLNILENSGWVIDEAATTAERMVLYYTGILPAGKESTAVCDTISIDPAVGTKVIETVKETEDGTVVAYVYEYDGYTAHIDAEINAVQTHNAEDAIKSAWGVDVSVAEDGSLSLR